MAVKHLKGMLKSILNSPLRSALKIIAAFAAASLVARWAIPSAYIFRGYSSIGGEALLILATFVFVLGLLNLNLRKILKIHRKEGTKKCSDVSTAEK